jgi:deoxycytidylate deaminase
MNLKAHPTEIAISLLNRSICAVQVAAVLVDNWGVYSWGWNHSGQSGYGEHAEAHCMRMSNKSRWEGSVLYIAARRKRNRRAVTARPCSECQKIIPKGVRVVYRDGNGVWCG